MTDNIVPQVVHQGNSEVDLSSLRLTQDFSSITVKKVITTIPIVKPNKQWFVRTHPDHRFECAILEIKEGVGSDPYVVPTDLMFDLAHEITPKILVLSINRQNSPFLWPIGLPSADGRMNPWNESALSAAEIAKTTWVRVVASQADGRYNTYAAQGNLSEPEWPEDLTFNQMLNIAFKGRVIDSIDHPVLRKLRGEI